MPLRTADIGRALALSVACAVGSVTTALAPVMGLPLMGAAWTRLRHSSGRGVTLAASVLCVALGVLLGPSALVLTVSGLLVAAFAGSRLRSAGAGMTTFVVVTALMVSLVAAEALAAYATGMSLLAEARSAAEAAAGVASALYGGTPGGAPIDQETLATLLLRTWPASYAFTALVAGVALVAAVGWAGRASGVTMSRLPKLRETDMHVWVLVLPVASVALLLIGAVVPNSSLYETAALNVALAARPLFLWQGLGVIAHRLEGVGTPGPLRAAVYALAVLLDVTLLLVSVVGLLDMWFNFRRLHRSDDRTGRQLGDGPDTL